MSGWGTSSWGTTAWGVGLAGPLTVVGAEATSERTVSVELSRAPSAGSALNPNTWLVVRTDTGADLIVIGVAQITPTIFSLYLLRKLGSSGVTHRATGATLVDGGGRLAGVPNFADFLGVVAEMLAANSVGIVDLDNPPFANGQAAGTYAVGTSGDYATHSGTAFLTKLIMRRLSTMPGGFFHLTDYGLGIRLKEPLSIPDMRKLKRETERQILREPEFASVQAGLSLDRNGILTILIQAILSGSNQEVTIPLEVPTHLISV